jgi:flagellin
MGLSIQTNVAALSAGGKLNKTSEAITNSINRLSTGMRITRPGDDPAGNQIADTLKADSQLAQAAIQNASSAMSFTSIADAALSGVSSLLTRMGELAEQSANGVFANSQRSALQNEFSALGSEIQRIAKSTEFNGVSLLSNSQSVTIQVGIDGTALSRIELAAITGTLDSLGLASSQSDVLTYSVISTSDAGAQDASQNALEAVKGALNSLNSTRGNIGATESRLRTAVSSLSAVREQFIAAEGRIRDVDVATETANLVKLQVLQSAQAAVLGQANQLPSIALSLLG